MFRLENLKDIVGAIIEAADEIREQGEGDAQDFGELLAYAEVLSIIRDECDEATQKELGLDFDIDKRYLTV